MDKFLTFPGLLLPLLGLALLASCGADARVAKETPLLTRALPDVPGREVLIETVVLAPGKVVPAHRHYSNAAVAIDDEVDLRLTNGAFFLPHPPQRQPAGLGAERRSDPRRRCARDVPLFSPSVR